MKATTTGVRMAAALAGAAGLCVTAVAQPKATPVNPVTPGTQPAATPGTQPKPAELSPPPPGTPAAEEGDPNELVMLPSFAEPVQLTTLIELVAKALKVNITTKGEVPGTVVFNAPVPVKKSELIDLLATLLEQQNYTIVRDRFGFYTVQTLADVGPGFGDDHAATRVFMTPNLRPNSLKPAIDAQFGPTNPSGKSYAYIDELGMIIATDTPRRLAALDTFLAKILEQYDRATFIRVELKHIAASVARDRALQLVGQMAQRSGVGLQQGIEQPAPGQGLTGRGNPLDNIGDRLTIDQQGNALVFRGVPEEIKQIKEVLDLIDVANSLTPRAYVVGSAAAQIASVSRQRGLGEVTTIADQQQGLQGQGIDFNRVQQQFQQQGTGIGGGPVMVVDEIRGQIIYYGTESQQEQLKSLVETLDPGAEKVTIQVYKLKNSDAEDVADVILGLIQNTTPVGTDILLPDGGQPTSRFGSLRSRSRDQQNQPRTPNQPNTPRTGNEDLMLDSSGFVIADTANNQVLVKAPAGQQPEFARLIEKLDLRRPQVYIEARIVAVTWTDSMRLAFETQLINAGGAGGVLNTDFGLGTFATGAAITGVKTVPPLAGLSAAVIKSDQVPIIMNALQTKTDAKILSRPQLLVDDNEEAEIVSLDQQPTSTISRGSSGQQDIVTAGDYAEAGTKLKVKPHISEGGYMRLEYSAELSSFTGDAANNLPPPRLENSITAASVTLPADTTVVVGGLNVDTNRLTRIQVPLLGDIPIVGLLFQDRTNSESTTTLYIFLTPRILRDPTFSDMRVLTDGPLKKAGLDPEVPPLRPVMIESGVAVLAKPENTPRLDPVLVEPARVEPAPVETPPSATPAGETPKDEQGQGS